MTYSLRQFRNMIADPIRMNAYLEAMRDAINPGDYVADIGTGTGVVAFAALALGAEHVIAIEPDPIIELGRREAARRGLGEQITFVEGFSTDYEPERLFDVIVADLRDVLPSNPGNISSIVDARERLLRPGGRLLPERDSFFACPVMPSSRSYVDESLQPPIEKSWNLPTLDLTLRDLDLRTRNEVAFVKASEAAPLAGGLQWGTYDYRLSTTAHVSGDLEWTVSQPGVLGGFHLWFDGVIGAGFGYSNAPGSPDLVYGNMLLEISDFVKVEAGDTISLDLMTNETKGFQLYRWQTEVSRGGNTLHSFDQTNFDSLPVTVS